VDDDRLARRFRRFADLDAARLPLYRRLARGVADDADLRSVLDVAPEHQARPVLLLAAVHDLVLARPELALGRWFPTVGGDPGRDGDPVAALRELIGDLGDELRSTVATRAVQTNEVNRSCLWHAAVRAAIDPGDQDRPLAVVEVGASAGLNLWFDRYGATLGGHRLGPPGAPVELDCPVVIGEPPLGRLLSPVVWRRGVDVAPVDLGDVGERRWLKACIWAEEADRHRRFDAAADFCGRHPPTVVADDAVDGAADLIEAAPAGAQVVVLGSWVLTYLSPERRAAFASVLDLLGRGRDLTWVAAEPAGASPGPAVAERSDATPTDATPTAVTLHRWRGGRVTAVALARCHPQLRWLEWLA